jgi:hypothetical protein
MVDLSLSYPPTEGGRATQGEDPNSLRRLGPLELIVAKTVGINADRQVARSGDRGLIGFEHPTELAIGAVDLETAIAGQAAGDFSHPQGEHD